MVLQFQVTEKQTGINTKGNLLVHIQGSPYMTGSKHPKKPLFYLPYLALILFFSWIGFLFQAGFV